MTAVVVVAATNGQFDNDMMVQVQKSDPTPSLPYMWPEAVSQMTPYFELNVFAVFRALCIAVTICYKSS